MIDVLAGTAAESWLMLSVLLSGEPLAGAVDKELDEFLRFCDSDAGRCTLCSLTAGVESCQHK